MARIKTCSLMLLAATLFAVFPSPSVHAFPAEVLEMEQRFDQEVGQVPMDSVYKELLIERAMESLLYYLDSPLVSPQYFLLVDRNPKAQTVSLAFFDSRTQKIVILGFGKTSTGNPKRIAFYETPIGIFKNTPSNMSYRALGTKNSKGWRAFGVKGSRVWDLGWQESKHHKGGPINIRLLIHATDPEAGEPRLGKPDSKGCIRVTAKLNRFLDYYGILDAEYERSERGKYVLLKNRAAVAMAGSLVIVVDSET